MQEEATIQLPFEAIIDMPAWSSDQGQAWVESVPLVDGFGEASAAQWLNNIASGAVGGVPAGLAIGGPWGALIGGLAGAGLGALQTALSGDQPAPSPVPPVPAPQQSLPTTPPKPPGSPPTGQAGSDTTAALVQQLAALVPALITALSHSGASQRENVPGPFLASDAVPIVDSGGSQPEDVPGPLLTSDAVPIADTLPIADARLAAHVSAAMEQREQSADAEVTP
jgi:hypothetical protein